MGSTDTEIRLATRKALSRLVDQAPPPPGWNAASEASRGAASQNPYSRRGPWVAAATAAIVIVVAIGGVALLTGGDGDNPSDVATSQAEDPPPSSTPAPPLTTEVRDLADLIIEVDASSSFPGFPSSELIDGSLETVWQDLSLRGDGAAIEFEFAVPVFIESITLHNYQDEEQRLRTYRVKDLEISLRDGGEIFRIESRSPGTTGPFTIDVAQLHEGLLTIRVLSTWPAEAVDEQRPAYLELAIAEIEFLGWEVTAAESLAPAEMTPLEPIQLSGPFPFIGLNMPDATFDEGTAGKWDDGQNTELQWRLDDGTVQITSRTTTAEEEAEYASDYRTAESKLTNTFESVEEVMVRQFPALRLKYPNRDDFVYRWVEGGAVVEVRMVLPEQRLDEVMAALVSMTETELLELVGPWVNPEDP